MFKFKFSYKNVLSIIGVLLMFMFGALLLWRSNVESFQATPASLALVYFDGDYRIGDGKWQEIKKGEHIPATKGDVTLRGNFHMLTPDGEYIGLLEKDIPISFYTNHINMTIYEGDIIYQIDAENPLFGQSACSKTWTYYTFAYDNTEPIEMVIHNPHTYGNDTAVDELLDNFSIWVNIDFEKGVLSAGQTQRNIGLIFIIISIVILGVALFSTIIHVKNCLIIWLFGFVVFFAGTYFIFTSTGISFWIDSRITNTLMLGISMMLYMFFISTIIVYILDKMKKVGLITIVTLGITNVLFFLLPLLTNIYFYDLLFYWAIIQSIANIVLASCIIYGFISTKDIKYKLFYSGLLLPLVFFILDEFMIYLGKWNKGISSQGVFTFIIVIALVVVLMVIPQSINSSMKAKELEVEKTALNSQLAETRISTMMSQIRPHFIYNTLGSIEQLCEIDPVKAGELVHDFAKYLRGNFGELANTKPIPMSQEMEHVHHYIRIENVRFPDMTFLFEMNSKDFYIPALSIQPIVENAIKHGLMKLEKGGTIKVISYETDTHYCVTIEDDGAGFDASVLLDEKEHMGLQNIRARLKAMVDGELQIESKIGVGTKVLIKIPKEGKR